MSASTSKRLGILSIVLKLSLLALLLVALATDAEQFRGKALASRIVFYPLGASIIAIVWYVRKLLGKSTAFPHRADVLVTLPFLIDTIGNWFNLFDLVSWWDDLMHFSLWFLLMLGFAPLLQSKNSDSKWRNVLLVGGVGALFAIYWELGEYFLFVQDNPTERATAYQDTIGDLVLGSTGGLLAAILDNYALKRKAIADVKA